ncbi:MAG: outer membrane beta-barrel protein [Thermoguttaceae bacterium]|nr:outer membrane beta-barrel protein [Thermoguttaceae bacterium]
MKMNGRISFRKRLALPASVLMAVVANEAFGADASTYYVAQVPAYESQASAEASPEAAQSASTAAQYAQQIPEQTFAPCCPEYVQPCCADAFQINGYVNGGYFGNTLGADSNVINTNSDRGGALNAAFVSLSKGAVTNGCGVDWGGGVDFMFGEDSRLFRVERGLDEDWATGHNRNGVPTYGFAMPQAYGALAINNWTFTAGHFFSPFGYESGRADKRFFYSRGLAYDALPSTLTGGLLTFSGIENLSATVGLVNGINQGFNDDAGGSLFAGNFVLTPSNQLSFTYTVGAGDVVDDGTNKVYGCIHSWIVEVKPDDRWTFATAAVYEDVNTVGAGGISEAIIGQHIYYKTSDCWKVGTRLEWGRLKPAGGDLTKDFEITLGANWSPAGSQNLTIRPEFRYDSCNVEKYAKNGDKKAQICLGVDAVATF